MKTQVTKISMLAILGGILISCNNIVDEIPANVNGENRSVINQQEESDINLRKGNYSLFGAFLTGTEEVPPVNANGAGSVKFEVINNGAGIKYEVRVANTEGIVAAHIHKAAFGVNGPIMVDLIPSQNASGLENGLIAEGILTAQDLRPLFASNNLNELISTLNIGLAYVNLHTQSNPGGQIRGQVSPILPNDNANFTGQLTGDQEIHPVETRSKGVAIFRFNKDNSAVNFQLNVTKLENSRFAHIHLGKRGENGPILVPLKSEKINGVFNGVYANGPLTESDLSGRLMG
ncbi:MAG TPA: CHRD domain-containing protein, partial [Lunatimonas sp.]|nr:CHRD domain-containing protein [Lunatimonas sp.]